MMKQENRQVPSPSLSKHPLMGVRLGNLFKLLRRQKGVSPDKWPFIFAFAASALARAPFSLIDRWKASNHRVAKKVEPPIFIVGFWRSGTTHLHNLLGRSSELGIITPLASGLPGELLTLGTWLEPLLQKGLPEDRGIDRVAVTPQSPQEDEIPLANRQLLSVFHALYFPDNFGQNFNRGVFFDGVSQAEIEYWKSQMLYFLGKVAIHQKQQPLLIKNPVYTARIALLRQIWPKARFIHIYRNPYRVYQSTMHYYPKMINDLGLQSYDAADIEPVIIQSYPRMLKKLYKDTANLSVNQFIEVRYEDLDQNPLKVLEKVYKQLNIPDWQAAKHPTKAYLKSLSSYRKNTYTYKKTDLEKVDKFWGEFAERWEYEPPVAITKK